jgi:EAL domain-containing protein (putative c-di-GMP-specific phosphodiesterase class I)
MLATVSALWFAPSFVRQVPHDAESAAIVRAIITMAKCLGMSTTVEGVETSAQFDFSVAAGCDTIQGYLISRPLDRASLAALIATMSKAPHPSVTA